MHHDDNVCFERAIWNVSFFEETVFGEQFWKGIFEKMIRWFW